MEDPFAPIASQEEIVLSVTQCIEYVNFVIGRKTVVVEGEITGYSVSQNKWVFFSLRDEQGVIACFAMVYQLSGRYEDGMRVRIWGTPRLHQKSGKFSLYIDRMEATGEGALKRAFELTKKQLEKEGIFAQERKRALPRMPKVIGLIDSKESAAHTDFMRILNQRWRGISVHHIQVRVQGEGAVDDIVKAFEWFNENDTGAEVIVMIRGGGSLEDLAAFNAEGVARAVFGSRLPVVCGVGHERDESLADYAADMRAATPTHAASLVVPDRQEVGAQIGRYVRTMVHAYESLLEWERHRVQQSARVVFLTIERAAQHVHHCIERIRNAFRYREQEIARFQRELVTIHTHSARSLTSCIVRRRESLASRTEMLRAVSPMGVLERGYSLIRKGGKVVDSVAALQEGENIDIVLHDGQRNARITQ